MHRPYFGFTLLLICIVLPLCSGCPKSDKAAKLIGSWKMDMGIGNMTATFSKDHTYVQTAVSLGGTASGTGEWKVDGDRLITVTKTSTFKNDAAGKQDTVQIVALDESVLVVKRRNEKGEEEAMTLQRVH